MERLLLEQLTVGQNGLRVCVEHLHGMMDFVANGRFWTEAEVRGLVPTENPRFGLIHLVEFRDESGDDMLLIHDGHHRLVATWLAGRSFLDPSEYRITRRTWEEYQAINFAAGWVTPLDPRTYVRRANFGTWKEQILALARTNPDLAEQRIRQEPDAYRQPRRYSDLASLCRDCGALQLDQWREQRQRCRQEFSAPLPKIPSD